MTSDASQPRDIAWGRAFRAGAVVGGIGWGLLAADVLTTPVDEAHWGTILEPRMLIAAIVSVVCLVIAAAMAALGRSAAPARAHVLRSVGTAFVVAVVSGWILLGVAVGSLIVSGGW